MKRLFYAIVALSLFTISCSKNDAPAAPETVTVSFTVTAPEMQTRSGEGWEATTLFYAFYDEEWNILTGLPNSLIGMSEFDGLNDGYSFKVKLVKDRTYHAIFFARGWFVSESMYTDVDLEETQTVRFNLDDIHLRAGYVEYCDAFYATVTNITTENPQNVVTLKRPFAQLNIASSVEDLQASADAGANVQSTKIIAKVPTELNLKDGSVGGEKTVDFGWNLEAAYYKYNGKGYSIIGYGYILCGTENAPKTLENITFKMNERPVETATDEDAVTRTFENVPIQRNCRTYILGDLTTGSADATTYEINLVPDITTDNVVNAQAQ